MPRPRIYPDKAARQRAYRARLRAIQRGKTDELIQRIRLQWRPLFSQLLAATDNQCLRTILQYYEITLLNAWVRSQFLPEVTALASFPTYISSSTPKIS